MNKDAQRIAIAEACPNLFWIYRNSEESRRSLRPAVARVFRLGEHPAEGDRECDPLNDLNVMHEAEKSLAIPQRVKYCDVLATIRAATIHESGAWWAIASATADQRAEAFLRTIGKWEDGK